MDKSKNLVWMDLEMTGLDSEIHRIIEIATIITDQDLRIIAEGPCIAVKFTLEELQAMEEWSRIHHAQSGLWDRALNSKYSLEDAEKQTLAFISQWVDPGKSPLCGNSIHQDRRFLYKYMPKLTEYLHYRNIDVTCLKELSHRWYPKRPQFKKKNSHRAMDDIRESIEELRFYRSTLLVQPD